MASSQQIRNVFEKGNGVFRLAPAFVPRRFSTAGQRLKLHPDDYYALGTARGSIKERWFSSVIAAMNGPLAPADEGMSYVDASGRIEDKFLFKDAVDELGAALIGKEMQERFGTWPMFSKFFDFNAPLFHHLHLRDEDARRVGRNAKPEAYYFPPQLNNHPGLFPHTYFGFDPDVTKEEVKARLALYEKGDNRITELSRAYRIELGTGWYTPPGVVHAPGSYLTYEPQWNSDVNSVYENIVDAEVYPLDFLVENCPEDRKHDLDYVISLMDWEKNIDPHYRKTYFRPPVVAASTDDYVEKWVVYATGYIAAKELTVFPGASATVKDCAAFGCIVMQGHGALGVYDAEAATLLRFGGLSADEFFVGETAAREGLRIVNRSKVEPLVLLKHFGPNAGDPAKA
jgi:hypothetical protein